MQWSDKANSYACAYLNVCVEFFLCQWDKVLTSLSRTFALNVHMAPLSVLFERTSLLVAATAMVALEGLLYCKRENRIEFICHLLSWTIGGQQVNTHKEYKEKQK